MLCGEKLFLNVAQVSTPRNRVCPIPMQASSLNRASGRNEPEALATESLRPSKHRLDNLQINVVHRR
jgi:hypothetical protein